MANGGLNRRLKRSLPKPKAPEPTLEQILAQMRYRAFTEAKATLDILEAVEPCAGFDSPERLEIAEGVRMVKHAILQNGLELVRPILKQLKPAASPADTPVKGGTDAQVVAV